MTIQLNQANIHLLPAALPAPTYERTAVQAGIVHFGVGGFHRAHQAFYLDQLMEQGLAMDFGIVGVGLLPGDKALGRALKAQDCLYTLVSKDEQGGQAAKVIGSIIDYLCGPDSPAAVLQRLAAPETRIVTLTITEGGYNFDQITGEFDWNDPDVAHDLAHPDRPRTVFGYLTQALARRRADGIVPFDVVSCDNIPSNGAVARRSLLAFARGADPDLADWIAAEVAFPNSMVDRITPRPTKAASAELAQRTGVVDNCVVVAEAFTQWVLEDGFGGRRPPFERAGVQLVADVEPYELMKLRLLNASHQALAYFSYLMGYRLVHDAVRDSLVRDFLADYMQHEGAPSLPQVPGVDLDAYQQTLIKRFGNEAIADTVARLAAEASDRIPKWLVPVVHQRLAAGAPAERSAAIVASWARFAEGVDESGTPFEVVDNQLEQVKAAARRQGADPLAFLRQESFFGSLADEPRFTEPYLKTLDSLHQRGARETLRSLVAV
ncbi:MAG: mannitol dehydrogenase family protein [Bifidobacteriaceae bacterium]|nr:mannitol dehydrogenase family protein [Bifidobacteriaceae bacterium]